MKTILVASYKTNAVMLRILSLCVVLLLLSAHVVPVVDAFHLVLMGRRGGGNLKRTLQGETGINRNKNSVIPNQGKGQEITGVTLPENNAMKGWEFGDRKTMVCAQVANQFYALQGDCPRCGFDLYKGELIFPDDPGGWTELPRVACPTCATTYSLQSGTFGPPIQRTGLAGFVGKLAKTATQGDRPVNAKAFQITIDDDETGRVFCRNKTRK